jgi:predicted ester cyclase
MQSKENKDVVLRLARAVNSGNLDDLDNVLSSNYIRHDPNPLIRDIGREQYKETFKSLRAAFPNAEWSLDEVLCDGDKVIGRWTFRGRQDGPFFNIPPSGREVTYPIIAVYRIEDGMIAEDWHIFHSIGLWQTLIPEIEDLVESATK